MFDWRRYTFLGLAAVFLITAILKMAMLTDPFVDIKLGYPKNILWLAIAIELSLAFANTKYKPDTILWCANLATFLVFTSASLFRMLNGYESCGCLGVITFPNWGMLLVDIGALCVIWISRPLSTAPLTTELFTIFRKSDGLVMGRVFGVVTIAIFIASVHLETLHPVKRLLLGNKPISGKVVLPKNLRQGNSIETVIQIQNTSATPTRVTGATTSCKCLSLNNPFTTICANSKVEIPLNVTITVDGIFHQRVILFIDHPKQNWIAIDLYGLSKKGRQ